jgi:hypothetical protein
MSIIGEQHAEELFQDCVAKPSGYEGALILRMARKNYPLATTERF